MADKPAEEVAAAPGEKVFDVEDLKKHTVKEDCWLAIGGKVYDVTDFLEEHPGGYDIVLDSCGKDATSDFEDIGHSNSAREMLAKYLIGNYAGGDEAEEKDTKTESLRPSTSTAQKFFQALLPLLLVVAAILLKLYGGSKPATE